MLSNVLQSFEVLFTAEQMCSQQQLFVRPDYDPRTADLTGTFCTKWKEREST